MCPFCGRRVIRAIRCGITTCNNCNRIFDSSSYHKILSAAWGVRRENIDDIECVKATYELTDEEADIVEKYVIMENYSHDDFIKIVNKFLN